jgi:hypothetical protein
MQYAALTLLAIALLALLLIQYSMIVTDIRNNNAKAWEIIIGIIPFGPYILMILTGIWHLATMPFRSNN